MSYSPLINQLIDALRYLPGVGPKSAQRMAFHLLQRGRDNGKQLASILALAMEQVNRCHTCRNFTEETVCRLCRHSQRDRTLLCVVEMPADVIAIEQSGSYRGLYFVLMGHLSPIDGIGPHDLGIDILQNRFATESEINEVILATNSTVEGEVTAHYIAELAKQHQIVVTRIARGVPLGGELEFVDGGTLARAMTTRSPVDASNT